MFLNSKAGCLVNQLITAIHENKDYLSEVDGKIGDGDHGVNMNKGFMMCGEKLKDMTEYSFSEALLTLSDTLMEGIGGSMGPLYGMFFAGLGDVAAENEEINENVFSEMLSAALEGIQDIGNAKRGDKTLLDTLIPGFEAYQAALDVGKDFNACLDDLKTAAEAGWRETENMVAKIGRASRLGERSRGVLDAGATSCYIILSTLTEGMKALNQ